MIALPLAPDALSAAETLELQALEAEIEGAFERAAMALATIRDKRLYRGTHTTFEAYVQDKHKRSERWARYQAAAGVTLQLISEARQSGTIVPMPERPSQVRSISTPAVKPQDRVKIWQDATAGGTKQPTAAEVQAAKDRLVVERAGYTVITNALATKQIAPKRAVQVVTALDSCQPTVRKDMQAQLVTDRSVILEMNRLYKEGRSSYPLILGANGLLFDDGRFIPLPHATAADLRAYLDERREMHRVMNVGSKTSSAVSTVVYPDDALATVKELAKVLTKAQMVALMKATTTYYKL